jgi:hypothetical protein
MNLIKDDILTFFNYKNKNIPDDLKLVKNTSITI